MSSGHIVVVLWFVVGASALLLTVLMALTLAEQFEHRDAHGEDAEAAPDPCELD